MADSSVRKYGGFHPDYAEEIDYFKKNKVYAIQLEMTTACEGGCLFCYASEENQLIRHMPKKDVKEVLDAAGDLGARGIDWLGGDPLLYPNWFPLMKQAQKRGLKNNIWTSGLPLADKDIARQAVEVTEGGFISVHLDTLNEEIYQHLHRGSARRNIDRIKKGVDAVLSLGKKPEHMLNCITFNRQVAKDAEHTIGYFMKEKGLRTCLTQMCPTGLAETHAEWIPTKEMIKPAVEARDRLNYPGSKVSFSTMDTNKFYCGGIICVTIDGDVTPCSVIREGVGNIHDLPLERIVREHRDTLLFTHLRSVDNLPFECRGCENNTVCWGCRAAAYYQSGDLYAMDPNCCMPEERQRKPVIEEEEGRYDVTEIEKT